MPRSYCSGGGSGCESISELFCRGTGCGVGRGQEGERGVKGGRKSLGGVRGENVQLVWEKRGLSWFGFVGWGL